VTITENLPDSQDISLDDFWVYMRFPAREPRVSRPALRADPHARQGKRNTSKAFGVTDTRSSPRHKQWLAMPSRKEWNCFTGGPFTPHGRPEDTGEALSESPRHGPEVYINDDGPSSFHGFDVRWPNSRRFCGPASPKLDRKRHRHVTPFVSSLPTLASPCEVHS
jgi:hypothetical protein